MSNVNILKTIGHWSNNLVKMAMLEEEKTCGTAIHFCVQTHYDPTDTYKQLTWTGRCSWFRGVFVLNGLVQSVMVGLIVHSVGETHTWMLVKLRQRRLSLMGTGIRQWEKWQCARISKIAKSSLPTSSFEFLVDQQFQFYMEKLKLCWRKVKLCWNSKRI